MEIMREHSIEVDLGNSDNSKIKTFSYHIGIVVEGFNEACRISHVLSYD